MYLLAIVALYYFKAPHWNLFTIHMLSEWARNRLIFASLLDDVDHWASRLQSMPSSKSLDCFWSIITFNFWISRRYCYFLILEWLISFLSTAWAWYYLYHQVLFLSLVSVDAISIDVFIADIYLFDKLIIFQRFINARASLPPDASIYKISFACELMIRLSLHYFRIDCHCRWHFFIVYFIWFVLLKHLLRS